MTRQIREAWDSLVYGIQSREGIIVLTGEAGTGKTTVINRLLDWLRERRMPTAYIFNSHLEPKHLFDFMLADFGVPPDPRWQGNALMGLSQWLPARFREGQIPVLIVDEAQGLPLHVLEEIRMLVNLENPHEKLLQIVLAGQPELEEKLRRPEMRQLKQRIAFRCRTAALAIQDTQEYLQVRLNIAGASGKPIFSPDAVGAVHAYSRGIPRVMNVLCEHALINAYAGNLHVVPARVVEDVAREFQFDRDVRAPSIRSGALAASASIYEPLIPEIAPEVTLPAARPAVQLPANLTERAAFAGGSVLRPSEPVAEQVPVPFVAPSQQRPIACSAVPSVALRKSMQPPIVRERIERTIKKTITGNFAPSRAMAWVSAAMRRGANSSSVLWANAGLRAREIRAGVYHWVTRTLDSRSLNRIAGAARSWAALAIRHLFALAVVVRRIVRVWWREAMGFWQRQQTSFERWLQKPLGQGQLANFRKFKIWSAKYFPRFGASLHPARTGQTPQQTIQPTVLRHAGGRSASTPLRRWLREPFRPPQPLHSGTRASAPRDRISSAL